MRLRNVMLGFTMLLVGVGVGMSLPPAHATTTCCEETGPWDVRAGQFGQQSFYAVKFNRQTGEAWVLSGERGAKDDSWLLLPDEKRPRR